MWQNATFFTQKGHLPILSPLTSCVLEKQEKEKEKVGCPQLSSSVIGGLTNTNFDQTCEDVDFDDGRRLGSEVLVFTPSFSLH